MPAPKSSSSSLQPDEFQQQAIDHVHGPLLVVAGAGTGKTTVLTRRIARLIRENIARPDEILAVTYTDNAAREMRERVLTELKGTDLRGLKIETFHAYCNNLLVANGRKFNVLDDKNLWMYLRRRLPELHLNHFVRAANVTQFLDDLLDFMRRCQDELVGPVAYEAYVERLERGEHSVPRVCKSKDADALSDAEVIARCREIAGVYTTVERMLAEENLGTFGHMITRAYELLCHGADLLNSERKRTRFILADEFQDANFAQVKILEQLAGEERNVFAVGDPDQAIYRFRGASSAAFELFQNHFEGTKLVALSKNRRSTTPILNCAFALIQQNPELFAKGSLSTYRRVRLISARDEAVSRAGKSVSAIPVSLVELPLKAKDLESNDVVSSIQRLRRETRCRWKDIAVLYRQHLHRDELVEELIARTIPFTIENMDVMDTPEARDLFACLGAVVSEADAASLVRVASLPQFEISPEDLRSAIRAIPRNSQDVTVALLLRKLKGGQAILETLGRAREQIAAENARGRRAMEIIVRDFDLRASPPLDAVLNFIAGWEKNPTTKTGRLAELLDYLEYFREARGTICLPSHDEDAVRLMTAHTAKGLEFQHVLILRANSNSFPSSYKEPLVAFPRELRFADSIAREDDKTLHNQEERRLFYVAMTRARDTLTIYARRGRGTKDPTPDGFMRELLKDPRLKPSLEKREPGSFQTDLFGEAESAPLVGSRACQWVSLPPVNELNATLSASSIETYKTCPLRFKLEREWRIPAEAPAAMQYGATMHQVLRAYYESVKAGSPLKEEALVEMFRVLLADAHLSDPYQHGLYERQGTVQLQQFLAAGRRCPPPRVLHTEERFEVKIAGTTVVGRIDRIDQGERGITITDYKTGKPKSQEDADESLQLSIYALAAKEKWGYQIDRLAFYNLAENTQMIAKRSDLELQQARYRIEEVAANIAEGKFDPNRGFHCRLCPYFNLCPVTEKRVHAPS